MQSNENDLILVALNNILSHSILIPKNYVVITLL